MNITELAIYKKMFGGGGITPSGEIEITENGTYDVAKYETAFVNAPSVIEVDELPNDNIEDKLVYIYKGDLYRYSYYDIWVLNDTLDNYEFELNSFSFFSNNTYYDSMGRNADFLKYNDVIVYHQDSGWVDEGYKTVSIIAPYKHHDWFNTNATQIMATGWNKYTLTQ